MRAKSILLLALALGCGLVASIGITQVMATRDAAGPATAETETIFVAMKDIPMGDPITAQMVKLEPWPKDKIPSGALAKLEDVEGRRPKAPIPAGCAILEKQLLGQGAADRLPSETIPTGFRVAAVKLDSQIGNANMIRPSDRVDVLVYVKQDQGKGIPQTVTKTILQDVKVFAVNDQFDVAATSGEKSMAAKTIWLLVTPEQAEDLTLAGELGQIRLVMRSPGDKEQKKLPGINPRKALEGDMFPQAQPEGIAKLPAEDKDSGTNKLLAMLGAKKEKEKEKEPPPPEAPAPAPQPKPNSSWTIRILAGNRVSDTVLESEAGSTPGANAERWRVATISEWSTPTPPTGPRAGAKPSGDRPAARPATGGDGPKDRPGKTDKGPTLEPAKKPGATG